MNPNKFQYNVELTVPKKIATFKDKKTGVSSFYLPFKFLDGKNGAITITRLDKEDFKPIDIVKSIQINFPD